MVVIAAIVGLGVASGYALVDLLGDTKDLKLKPPKKPQQQKQQRQKKDDSDD